MTVQVELPKAFSVRDYHEFEAHGHLAARMNPELRVRPVAQGLHVNGGPTVYWGIIFHAEKSLTDKEIREALVEAGFDDNHNGAKYEVHV